MFIVRTPIPIGGYSEEEESISVQFFPVHVLLEWRVYTERTFSFFSFLFVIFNWTDVLLVILSHDN